MKLRWGQAYTAKDFPGDIHSCYVKGGDSVHAVRDYLNEHDVTADPEEARRLIVDEIGLSPEKTDEEILECLVWIAAGDLDDNEEFYFGI